MNTPSPGIESVRRSSAVPSPDIVRSLITELVEISRCCDPVISRRLGALSNRSHILIEQVLESEETLASLKKELRTNPVTGLLNRRGYEERVRQTVAQWQRSNPENQGIALVRIDLDGFRNVNNQFGHENGDVALRTVAQRLGIDRRDYDLLVHFSGDEFGMALPGINLDKRFGLIAAIERTRARIAEPIDIDDGNKQAYINASIGVLFITPEGLCDLADDDELLDEAFKYADELQTDAKRTGKAQVLAADWLYPQE